MVEGNTKLAKARQFIIVGASGAGKSTLAQALSSRTEIPVVESETLAEAALGMSMQDAYILDTSRAEEAALDAALSALNESGDEPSIVVLTPSAGVHPRVLPELEKCRQAGWTVVGVDAPLTDLVRRSGLIAAQPGYLGTPRAWFRKMHEQLVSRYQPVCDLWFDTGKMSAKLIASSVVEMDALD